MAQKLQEQETDWKPSSRLYAEAIKAVTGSPGVEVEGLELVGSRS